MIKTLKSLSLIGARTRFFERCLSRLEQIPTRRECLLSVLTYHRVCYPTETPDLNPTLISSIPERFAEQMEYLSKNCHLISMSELLDIRRNNLPLPPRAVMVTFDDAYFDFAKYAWPIIQLYDIPVTLFVPTGFPDNPDAAFWWDRLYMAVCQTPELKRIETTSGEIFLTDDRQRMGVVKQIRDHIKLLPHHEAMTLVNSVCRQAGDPTPRRAVLSWQKLLELAELGVTLGAHTQAHPLLNRVSTNIARKEIVYSQEELSRRGVDALPRADCRGSGGPD